MNISHATVIDSNNKRVDFIEVVDGVPNYEMPDGYALVFQDFETANKLAAEWTDVVWKNEEWVSGGEPIDLPAGIDRPVPEPVLTEDEAEFVRGLMEGVMSTGRATAPRELGALTGEALFLMDTSVAGAVHDRVD